MKMQGFFSVALGLFLHLEREGIRCCSTETCVFSLFVGLVEKQEQSLFNDLGHIKIF